MPVGFFPSDVNLKLFKEPDFDGLSSALVREDIGQLFIGGRGKIITLSLDDITKKTSETNWMVSSEDKSLCQTKGKSIEDCDNYITMMHTLDDGRILVCGTKAFDPTCTHLIFKEGNVIMEDTTENGRGKIPFNPKERFASMMTAAKHYGRGAGCHLESLDVLPGPARIQRQSSGRGAVAVALTGHGPKHRLLSQIFCSLYQRMTWMKFFLISTLVTDIQVFTRSRLNILNSIISIIIIVTVLITDALSECQLETSSKETGLA
ncbi:hypothetical protein CCH79_00015187 [Gambusia affinis]|uniref:Sema domain-containing protein n=1 Tax=Gambusia affinis TaxID=33528 RepID=A0A315VI33_GAMAF|nr:hypothetical protein CCH79_00015187 [Gambusia affinis]